MKKRRFFLIASYMSIVGCAMPTLPEFVKAPDPPAGWNISLDINMECPNFNGKFESIPTVAELKKDGSWVSTRGDWSDYLLLIPFNRANAHDLGISYEHFPGVLLFESDDQMATFRIVSPDKNNQNFRSHGFSKANGDYGCDGGNLIFPEIEYRGGTEGALLNGKIYRQASETSDGDLLFYEQVQSHKNTHKYYLFRRER